MPSPNPFYTPEVQGPYQMISIGHFELEEGGVFEDLQLAVSTQGQLNDEKDNAILITTWFSGTHQAWEQLYIGEGRALDPAKYFIVIVNQIGNGLSTSPNNIGGDQAGPNFPKVRIGDDVRAQKILLEQEWGITSLFAVLGGSMGAQQTWEWAVRFPDAVRHAAAIAGTAQNTPHDFLFTKTLNDAITSDPGFNEGHYESREEVEAGLRRHADIWAVMGFSTEFWKTEFWKPFVPEGQSWNFEEFSQNFLGSLFAQMDPNVLLTMAWKWQRGDVARNTDGDLSAALGRVQAKFFDMPISSDMFFPPADAQAEVDLCPTAELRVLDSVCGHFGLFGFEQSYFEQVDAHLNELFST
ncbi:alpha/beta fold hydrolase [Corynebacterium sp. S7]